MNNLSQGILQQLVLVMECGETTICCMDSLISSSVMDTHSYIILSASQLPFMRVTEERFISKWQLIILLSEKGWRKVLDGLLYNISMCICCLTIWFEFMCVLRTFIEVKIHYLCQTAVIGSQ